MRPLSEADLKRCRKFGESAREVADAAMALMAYGQENIDSWFPGLWPALKAGAEAANLLADAAEQIYIKARFP